MWEGVIQVEWRGEVLKTPLSAVHLIERWPMQGEGRGLDEGKA